MNDKLSIALRINIYTRFVKSRKSDFLRFPSFQLFPPLVRQGRLSYLIVFVFISIFFNQCTWGSGQVTESSSREVFGFTYADQDYSYYEAGLVIRKLFDRKTFYISLSDIPIKKEDQSILSKDDPLPPWEQSCLAPKSVIRLKLRKGKDTMTVRVDFRSPFAFGKGKKMKSEERMSHWIASCHCRTPEEEINGQCFSDQLIKAIERKLKNESLTKVESLAKFEFKSLTQEARQRIIHEIGMPFGAFNVLMYRERGLTKHGDALPYFGQLLRPGERLCFHSSTYSSTWHEDFKSISTSEPAQPACFEWETLLRARYQNGEKPSKALVSTGLDPLNRWTSGWDDSTNETTLSVEPRDGDRIVASPDAITRPEEGPFRYVLVFTKNKEFLIPFGPERDLIINKKSSVPKIRGNFILLVRDLRLVNYIRENFAKYDSCQDPNKQGNEFKYLFNEKPHEYLECLVQEWGKTVKTDISADKVKVWLLDVILPSNVRPFVAFEILVDNQPVQVRAGMNLLNIIDRRFELSAQVFDLRSDGSGDTSESPTTQETVLIQNAANRV